MFALASRDGVGAHQWFRLALIPIALLTIVLNTSSAVGWPISPKAVNLSLVYLTGAGVAAAVLTTWRDQLAYNLIMLTAIVASLLLEILLQDPELRPLVSVALPLIAFALPTAVPLTKRTAPRFQIAAINDGLAPETLEFFAGRAQLISASSVDVDLPKGFTLLLNDISIAAKPEWSAFIRKSALGGCRTLTVSEFLEIETGRVRLSDLPNSLFLRRLNGGRGYDAIKPALDFWISLIALILLVPVFAIVAVLIAITIGRPILFIQKRVGLDGKIFDMYKFRTMIINSEANVIATAVDDARVTRVGRRLRRMHVDELPQLWNILIGDMSLIGPRPEQPSLTRSYAAAVPEFSLRTLIKPGLTGWAQVRFGYAATTDETRNKLEYDLYYLFNRGPLLDAKILLLTLVQQFRDGNVR